MSNAQDVLQLKDKVSLTVIRRSESGTDLEYRDGNKVEMFTSKSDSTEVKPEPTPHDGHYTPKFEDP